MELERFKRRTVTFCDGVSVDGYRLANDEFRVGIVGASKALGFAENWLYKLLSNPDGKTMKDLQNMGFSGFLLAGVVARENQRGTSQVSTLSIDDFNILLTYVSLYKKNDSAMKIQIAINQGSAKVVETGEPFLWNITPIQIGQINTSQKTVSLSSEKKIQKKLASLLIGSSKEVPTPAGRIDILTSKEIIEIKEWQRWKEAVGQIICYGNYYPSHRKRIHFFGVAHSDFISMVTSHCEKLGIMTTWE
jgi:hypothetical protein